MFSTISMCCTSWLRSAYVVPATLRMMNVSMTLSSGLKAAPLRGISDGPRAPHPDDPRQRRRVENEHDTAVAEIGRARDAFDPRKRIRNRAYHDFALSDDAIDHQPEAVRSAADHKHVEVIARAALDC